MHAIEAGILTAAELPDGLPADGKRDLLAFLIDAMITGSLRSGTVGMRDDGAEVLAVMRAYNYESSTPAPPPTRRQTG